MTVSNVFDGDKRFGIKNPISKSDGVGVFEQTKTSIEKYKSSLYTLLFTNIGERPMMPNYGTNMRKYLFEQVTDETFGSIKGDIISKVKYWIPEIVVNDIGFKNLDSDIENNVINIIIKFSLVRDSSTQDFIEIKTRVQ